MPGHDSSFVWRISLSPARRGFVAESCSEPRPGRGGQNFSAGLASKPSNLSKLNTAVRAVETRLYSSGSVRMALFRFALLTPSFRLTRRSHRLMAQPRFRVLAIASHPVQYMAPLFRRMAAAPALDLEVAYCSLRGAAAAGYDPDFQTAVRWDIPLL